jgi:hypothetical protein
MAITHHGEKKTGRTLTEGYDALNPRRKIGEGEKRVSINRKNPPSGGTAAAAPPPKTDKKRE